MTGPLLLAVARWLLIGVAGLVAWPTGAAHPSSRWETYTRAGLDAHERGRYAEAEKMFLAALREAKAFGSADARLVKSRLNLARVYLTLHQYAEAEPLLREAIALEERLAGPRHPAVADILADYAVVLRRTGRGAEAVTVEARIRAIRTDPVLHGSSVMWVKPGATPRDFERDENACLEEAHYGMSRYGPLIDPDVYTRCIEARGWRQTTPAPAKAGKEVNR